MLSTEATQSPARVGTPSARQCSVVVRSVLRSGSSGRVSCCVTNRAGVAWGFSRTDDVAQVHQSVAEYPADHGVHIDIYSCCPYYLAGVVQAFVRAREDRSICKLRNIEFGAGK